MKYSIISDVHVKEPGDQAEELLLKFLTNEDVISSDGIILLGDIFDLMIGPHSQYFSRFSKYFVKIKGLIELGKTIYYVPGNHDFHLEKLYQNFFSIHKHLNPDLFIMKNQITLIDGHKKIMLAHGDDVELNNPGQRKFKALVTSEPLSFFANNLMPYFLITKVGEFSSKQSRQKNNARYSKDQDVSKIKINFRNSAEEFFKTNPCSIIVLGHSHVKDIYHSDKNFTYVNNGYAQHTLTYISIEDGNVCFKNI